MKQDFL